MSTTRKLAARIVMAGFTIAALIGIFILLSPGSLGEIQFRLLGTTTLVGVVSLAIFCYLAVAESHWRWLGLAGFAFTIAPTIFVLLTIWLTTFNPSMQVVNWVVVSGIFAATAAQLSLLVGFGWHRGRRVRLVLALTLGAALVLAVMMSWITLEGGDSEAWARAVGVVAILDTLGSIIVIALGFLAPHHEAVTLTAATQKALREAAKDGESPKQLAEEAVRRFLATRET